MNRSFHISAGIVSMLLLGGCATVPRAAGFADAEKGVAERTGHRVHWNQGTTADHAVEAGIQGLLEKELSADQACRSRC